MFLTLNNDGSGFDPALKNQKKYDFFFLSSALAGDFITLSDQVSFKVFNDCLVCSLKRNKDVFILSDSSIFKEQWVELVKDRDFMIHDEFIYIGVALKEKLQSLKPANTDKICLKVLSNNYSQL